MLSQATAAGGVSVTVSNMINTLSQWEPNVLQYGTLSFIPRAAGNFNVQPIEAQGYISATQMLVINSISGSSEG